MSSARLAAWLRQTISAALPGLDAGEIGYLVFIARTFLMGLGLVLLLLVVVRLERPRSVRSLFRIGPVDWPGLGLLFVFLAVLNGAEQLFLRRFLYRPFQSLLVALGFPLPAAAPPLQPDPRLAALNLVLLLLVAWVEAPEELFFRGYLQNHLQARIGSTPALLVSAVVWDAWHAFDPAGFLRRLFFGVALGLVFRLRQNTTPLAIGHPVANRLLLAGSLVLSRLRGG